VKVSRFWISGGSTLLIFRTCVFDVKTERFAITLSPKAEIDVIAEALKRLFSILQHTPVSAVGFNCQAHWKTSAGLRKLQSLFTGDEKLFSQVFGSKETKIGGKVKFRDLGALVTFDTEHSARLDGGLFFNFNFHYDIEQGAADGSAKKLIELLSNFDRALSRAHSIVTQLYGKPIDYLRLDEVASLTGEDENGKGKHK
jgi:hypothetical protein